METKDIIKPENLVYQKSRLMSENVFNFCPGCGHGVVVRTIAEVIEEMGIENDVIGISPVGCSVFLYDFYKFDVIQAAHGRACAVATGLKRVMPDKFVFAYQGDGDLAAIGTGETIHACNRGENIVIIFINNGIYGMTGGQMAPTTLEGMKTTTSPRGRDVETMGYPLDITPLLAQLDGTFYVTRHAVHTPAAVRRMKKALRRAFENQKNKKGTSIVEVVSNCNSGWGLNPQASNNWMEKVMFKKYPLGDMKVDGKLVISKD
ncbi:MAG TPA: thiamine pyrophosphate-dependent enzyme [Bacteroidaceae bacterium]|nr:thiamine pyrophosphate-dependent enzyme [Bacteroidaceae bacterium]